MYDIFARIKEQWERTLAIREGDVGWLISEVERLKDFERNNQKDTDMEKSNYAYIALTPQKARAIEMHQELVEVLQIAADTLDMSKNDNDIAVRKLIQATLTKARRPIV